ncbi:MAG: flagellar hook-length control protein FliK [Syntrophales bacterium]|nr:flagellar hook-length control protein FliK [Syntrophales bacterium]
MAAGGIIAIQEAILPVDIGGGLSRLNTRLRGGERIGASVQFCDLMRGEYPTTGDDVVDCQELCEEGDGNTAESFQTVREVRLSGPGVRGGAKEGTVSDSDKINEKSKVAVWDLFQVEGECRGTGKSIQVVKEDQLSGVGVRDGAKEVTAVALSGKVNEKSEMRDLLQVEGDYRGTGKSIQIVKGGLLSEMEMKDNTRKAAARSEKESTSTGSDLGKIKEKSKVAVRDLLRVEGGYRDTGKSTQVVKEGLLSEMAMKDNTRKAAVRPEKDSTNTGEIPRDPPLGRYGKEGNLSTDLASMRSNSKNAQRYHMAQVEGNSDGNAKGQVRQDTMMSGGYVKEVVSPDSKPAADTRGDIGELSLLLVHEGVRGPFSKVRSATVDRIFPEGFQHVVVQGEGCVVIDNAGGIKLRPHVLIRQIADTVGARPASESGRIRMVLNPPHLGTVDMDVSIRNNKVFAVLHTDSNDVKHALQSNMEQLKVSFHNQGLTVDSISVFLHDKSDGAQCGFTGESPHREDSGGDEGQLPEDREEPFPVKGHPGIDGCVNVFA